MNDLINSASKSDEKARPETSKAGKISLWFIRVDLLLIIILTVYAILAFNLTFLWIAAALLVPLLFVMGYNAWIRRIKWVREKLQKESAEQEARAQESAPK